jgi:hypothetical protein
MTQDFDDIGDCAIYFLGPQVTHAVENDMAMRREDPVGSNIASLPQSTIVEISIFQWHGILIPHSLAGDLTQNEIIPRQA